MGSAASRDAVNVSNRLAHRQLEGELMDDPQLSAHAHGHALRGLSRINRVSRTAAVVWRPIARIARAYPQRTLSVLDIATGGGDLPIALCRRARRRQLAMDVHGCDISANAVGHARAGAAGAQIPVRFFCVDVLADELPGRYDIIVASLFLHHLADAQVVALLRKLAECADHVLVSDLIRCHTGYGLAYIGTRLLSRSPVVRIDGMRSVRAAFTIAEARDLAARAGLANVRFERRWPSRFLMSWHRESATNA